MSVFNDISTTWQEILKTPELEKILNIISNIPNLAPPLSDIFNAFKYIESPNKIKVIIIGQDPYIKGEANGLSFSTRAGFKIPPSLDNIYKAIIKSYPGTEILNGDLTYWAQQGVLLLNAALTTVLGKSNEHAELWQKYTDDLIVRLAKNNNFALITWGDFATKKARLVLNIKNFKWRHPSPMANASAAEKDKFINCDNFLEVNKWLRENNHAEIVWTCGTNKNNINTEPLVNDEASPNITSVESHVNSEASQNTKSIKLLVNGEASPGLRLIESHGVWKGDRVPFQGLIVVFTDGAAKANGKAACKARWGAYIPAAPFYESNGTKSDNIGYSREVCLSGDITENPTNNRAEFGGICAAICWCITNLNLNTRILIVSDSDYCINTLTIWYDNWKDKNILNEKKNIDTVELILKYMKYLPNLSFLHMRGHFKDTNVCHEYKLGNDRADKLAVGN
jgi:uracil-DNA glycosylase